MNANLHFAGWRRALQIAGAIYALLFALILLVFFIGMYLTVHSCEITQNCDVVPILTPLPILAILGLVGGATLALRSRASWLLVVVWALMVAGPAGASIYFLIPSIRDAWGLPQMTVPMALFAVLRDPMWLISVAGLALALLGLLPARGEVRQ